MKFIQFVSWMLLSHLIILKQQQPDALPTQQIGWKKLRRDLKKFQKFSQTSTVYCSVQSLLLSFPSSLHATSFPIHQIHNSCDKHRMIAPEGFIDIPSKVLMTRNLILRWTWWELCKMLVSIMILEESLRNGFIKRHEKETMLRPLSRDREPG